MSYGAPPPPPSSPYGGSPYGGQPQQSTSVMSIIALVLGIIAIPGCGCFVFSIGAIVLGILGRNEVAKSGGTKKGGGMATAGLVLGVVTLLLAIVINVLYLTGALTLDYGYYDS